MTTSDGAARAITLDELPRYSRWPAILLGAKPFAPKTRTSSEVLREYDHEKWGSVLAWLRQNEHVSADSLLQQQGLSPEMEIAFARGPQFFVAPARAVMNAYSKLLSSVLAEFRADTLVELGCGLGDKLLGLASELKPRHVYGGEFTQSGVECGRILAQRAGVNATFARFDYNDPSTLESVPPGALIYTSHSIEQIPNLKESFIEGVLQKSPIAVVHFEPAYEDQDEQSLIGLMRRRYAETNDYNRNLVGLLQEFENRGRLKILRHDKNIFSDTPFNPTSILAWRPA